MATLLVVQLICAFLLASLPGSRDVVRLVRNVVVIERDLIKVTRPFFLEVKMSRGSMDDDLSISSISFRLRSNGGNIVEG